MTSLQTRAEYAIEVHNGLLVRARAAATVREAASARADAARAALAVAQSRAEAARSRSAQAQSEAVAAEQAQSVAHDEAVAAQLTLDRMAAGAFRGQGRFGMLAQLMTARDPLELATGHQLMNSVADQQNRLISSLAVAKALADATARQSSATREQAVVAERSATEAAAERDEAASRSEAALAEAADDARVAERRADQASRAQRRAAVLVAQAQAGLRKAVLTAAQLERVAAEARRQAEATRRAGLSSGRSVPPSQAARVAIDAAYSQIGVPYSWGGGDAEGPTYGFAQGAGTKGFDCSGLTLYAYARAGIRLDHYSGSQWNQGKRISSRSDLQPGDLMFFATDTSNSSTIHHVGIYLGSGKMIEAPYTGEVVRVAQLGPVGLHRRHPPVGLRFDSAGPIGSLVRRTVGHPRVSRVTLAVMPGIDRSLSRLTGGRFVLSSLLVPTLVLHTTGARSGLPRTSPLATLVGEGGWYVVGSNFGGGDHPGWSANLLVHPQASVVHAGRATPVTARLLDEADKQQVWPRLRAVWPAYDDYVARSGRDLRVFHLLPR